VATLIAAGVIPPLYSGPLSRGTSACALNELSDPKRKDDFPSVAVASDGIVWAAWASNSGFYEHLRSGREAPAIPEVQRTENEQV
jgi:hypothetical protein